MILKLMSVRHKITQTADNWRLALSIAHAGFHTSCIFAFGKKQGPRWTELGTQLLQALVVGTCTSSLGLVMRVSF